MTLYNCRTAPDNSWRVTKFDEDLEVESSYVLKVVQGRFRCQCFQANKPSCRHRDMLERFITQKKVDTTMFYHYEAGMWVDPITKRIE